MTPQGDQITIDIAGALAGNGDEIAIAIGGQQAPPETVACNIAPFYAIATAGAGDTGLGSPANVVDGNIDTDWVADASDGTASLTLDLGVSIEIRQYTIGLGFGTSFQPPHTWVLDASDDQTDWTELDSQTGVSLPLSGINSFDITPSSFRYWRLTFNQTEFFKLSEFGLIRDCLAPPQVETALISLQPSGLDLQPSLDLLIRTANIALQPDPLRLSVAALELQPANIAAATQILRMASESPKLSTVQIVADAPGLSLVGSPIVLQDADAAIQPSQLGLLASGANLAVTTADTTIDAGQIEVQESGLVVSSAELSVDVGQLSLSGAAIVLRTADIAIPTSPLAVAPVDVADRFVRRPGIPFTSLIPLRRTSVWGGFADVRPIPWRYGAVTGRLLQHNSQRTLFVWADHPCQGIDEVLIGGLAAGGWRWYNGVDNTGAAVCFVEFGQPVDDGASVVARGRGRMIGNGELMTNPADVIADIRATIAGQVIDPGQMDDFRDDAAAAGIEIAGSISDDTQSLQRLISDIIFSVDAVWSAGMAGFARLRTGLNQTGITLDESLNGPFSAEADLDRVINVLDIDYANDDDGPTSSLIIEAPRSIDDFGRRSQTLSMPWISSARLVESAGQQILQRSARPVWSASFEGELDAGLGDVVSIDRASVPFIGPALITGVDTDQRSGRISITTEQLATGTEPVSLIRSGSQFTLQPGTSATIATIGEDRVLTILDSNNGPISSAAVTLNGTLTRLTDSGGRVAFPAAAMPEGEHVLEVDAGGQSYSFTVVV